MFHVFTFFFFYFLPQLRTCTCLCTSVCWKCGHLRISVLVDVSEWLLCVPNWKARRVHLQLWGGGPTHTSRPSGLSQIFRFSNLIAWDERGGSGWEHSCSGPHGVCKSSSRRSSTVFWSLCAPPCMPPHPPHTHTQSK